MTSPSSSTDRHLALAGDLLDLAAPSVITFRNFGPRRGRGPSTLVMAGLLRHCARSRRMAARAGRLERSPADIELHRPDLMGSVGSRDGTAEDGLTGATGGLGRAIAPRSPSGASLVLSSARARSSRGSLLSRASTGWRWRPGRARRGAELLAEAGEIDVLVANAGCRLGKLDDFSSDEVERALRVNLESPMLMAHALLPRMLERGKGHLVMVGRSRDSRRPLASPSTTPPSSGSAASRSRCARTCAGTGASASLVAPASSATPACSPTRRHAPPPGWARPRPSEVALQWSRRSRRIAARSAVAPFRQTRSRSSREPPRARRPAVEQGGVKAGDEVARGHKAAGKQ